MASALQTFYPKISSDIPWEMRQHLQLIYQKLNNHAQAIVDSHTTVSKTILERVGESSGPSGGGGGGGSTMLPGLGGVNNQSGQTAYTTQNSDGGILIVLNDASAIAITLNTGVATPWMAFFTNQGSSTATLTPTSGTISYAGNTGASSMPLDGDFSCLVAFDGTNWWAWTIPNSNGFPNPMTSEGDLIAGGAGGAPGRLGIGASGDVLTSNGTDPSWQPPSAAGVASLNSETGAVSLTSSGGTVTITTPTSGTVNLEAAGGGGGGYLKGTVTLSWSAGPSFAQAYATVAGATLSMSALLMVPPGSGSGTSFPIEQGYLSAFVFAANTVDCLYHVPAGLPSGGPTTFPVLVFP